MILRLIKRLETILKSDSSPRLAPCGGLDQVRRGHEKGCAGQASLWRVGATTNIRIGFGVSMGFGLPVWICFRSGGQRDILSKLQDGAGFNLCHCVQGEQAEDEDKGGVRVSVAVAYILKITPLLKSPIRYGPFIDI